MSNQHVKLAHFDIIRSPILTEKSNLLTTHNQYFFNVSLTATKPQIKEAFEAVFGVEVKSVNTLVRKGKQRIFRGRRGKQNDVKKAMISLKAGQRIDVATGV
ncbi:MAG: 50S ribosomal protein L23 [Pseudomonadota bacterium]|jgi:large subunit ribosomal protein L23|nr:50S ribosomal protein L23 [Pseudomonadota bacterium]